jgi:hypothetical protein
MMIMVLLLFRSASRWVYFPEEDEVAKI